MIEYYNKPIYIRKSISNNLLLRYKKMYFDFVQNNRLKKMIINHKNVLLLSSSLSKLGSLILLNKSKIFYNNKN